MAGATFLHGVEVITLDDGPRPVRTVRTSVIGIAGTAPNADPAKFPLNKPVLIAGSRRDAGLLDTTPTKTGLGTLPNDVDLILDQIGAAVVVVRVDDTGDAAAILAAILGGVDGDGNYTGVHAFLAAQTDLGVTPRILIAPGFTSDRPVGVDAINLTAQGDGYAAVPAVSFTGGGGGTGAAAHAVVTGGKVTSIVIDSPGQGYTANPVVVLTGGAPTTPATATAVTGPSANPVVAELLGIAERLKAVVIADLPATTDADAIAYRGDWGSKRIFGIYPEVKVSRGGNTVITPASPAVAGLIAKIDNDRGFWNSPSNQVINGILGTSKAIDFAMGDANSRANFLNESEVATIVREDGFRLWGNRTFSDDPKFAFLSVVRTADIINDSILRAHLWAVDRNITKTYISDVEESVNAYMRGLIALGAILYGKCWADPDLNDAASIADGKVWFNIDFTPPYPAEHIIFRSRIVNDGLEDLVV